MERAISSCCFAFCKRTAVATKLCRPFLERRAKRIADFDFYRIAVGAKAAMDMLVVSHSRLPLRATRCFSTITSMDSGATKLRR
ncbi:MAG: hypothetical protein FWH31_11010 [Streptococcaceae bacterium]|nr:hypothetical protein [Streptococcaceae bacterium]